MVLPGLRAQDLAAPVPAALRVAETAKTFDQWLRLVQSLPPIEALSPAQSLLQIAIVNPIQILYPGTVSLWSLTESLETI